MPQPQKPAICNVCCLWLVLGGASLRLNASSSIHAQGSPLTGLHPNPRYRLSIAVQQPSPAAHAGARHGQGDSLL